MPVLQGLPLSSVKGCLHFGQFPACCFDNLANHILNELLVVSRQVLEHNGGYNVHKGQWCRANARTKSMGKRWMAATAAAIGAANVASTSGMGAFRRPLHSGAFDFKDSELHLVYNWCDRW
mmetsp:Transcript_62132/g.162803  ORF Transcript_62132/g.162803 Transcript_62132/m.162803 type:complete len:121 (+) Transcript_62132:623-985(+)